ncbi:MAG: glycosyltransferase [Ferruginibacter sp.]
MEPLVSIVMPAYNAGPYLSQTIDSILAQDYKQFEFIIINDGSTDNSETIIQSYSDSRIRLHSNPGNKGLIYSLNKGVELAQGKYIARIDGDDLALPTRLSRQVQYLEANPGCDVLATTVALINEKGDGCGNWPADIKNITAAQIKNYLPKDNCIAHPAVMIKTQLLKIFKYDAEQKLGEDYDLWLRLIAAGKEIRKLEEPLTLHRILTTSFTRTRMRNGYYKISRIKRKFVYKQLAQKRCNLFILKTALFALFNLIKGTVKEIKWRLKKS